MRFLTTMMLFAAMAILGGCSNSGLHSVSGTVTFDGEPLESAMVQFLPEDNAGSPASGVTDGSGNFRLTTFKEDDGVKPGKYKVLVMMFDPNVEATPTMAETMAKQYANKQNVEGKDVNKNAAKQYYADQKTAKKNRPKIDKTPDIYNQVAKTPLSADVPAQTSYKFDLKKDAK